MLQQSWAKWVVLLMFCTILLACIDTANLFKTFTPDELVGTWEAKYEKFEYHGMKITGIETLILKADGTYQQIYDDGKGYRYTSPWSRWWLEDGQVLHLDGGRFYALGIEMAESYARGGALTVGGVTKRDLIGEMIFNVEPMPFRPGEAVLVSPPVGDPDAPKFARFYRVSASILTPSADP